MKRMNTFMVGALVIALILAFAGCKQATSTPDVEMVGYWISTQSDSVFFQFNADKTLAFTTGNGIPKPGIYTVSGNKVSITLSTSGAIEVTVDNNSFTLNNQVFVKGQLPG